MKTTWKVIMIFTTVLLVLASAVYAAVNITRAGNVDKNVNLFSSTSYITDNSTVGGNLLIFKPVQEY